MWGMSSAERVALRFQEAASAVVAERSPAMIPVTRFFGRARAAYAKWLNDNVGYNWEPSSHIGESFNGVSYRWWLDSKSLQPDDTLTPMERISIELSISPSKTEGTLQMRAEATKQNRGVAFVYHESVPVEDLKHPGKIFTSKFVSDLKATLSGSYEKELGEVQARMAEMVEKHKELDKNLGQLEKLVEGGAVRNFKEIADVAREVAYAASNIDRSALSLVKDIQVVVERK
jgi:hypothetical protein